LWRVDLRVLLQIFKSQLEKTLFIVLVVGLTLISGLFALLGGEILASLGIKDRVTTFVQLGLFIMCYFVLARFAASKLT